MTKVLIRAVFRCNDGMTTRLPIISLVAAETTLKKFMTRATKTHTKWTRLNPCILLSNQRQQSSLAFQTAIPILIYRLNLLRLSSLQTASQASTIHIWTKTYAHSHHT